VTIDRPPRPSRPESREVTELKQLKVAQPELASAIDMQIALVEMQRRVQSRVPLPWIHTEPDWVRTQYAAGRPVVRFGDIPLDWTDFRLTLRQTSDILRRFETLEQADYDQIVAFGRDGGLEPLVKRWYEATSGIEGGHPLTRAPEGAPASLDQVLVIAVIMPNASRRLICGRCVAQWSFDPLTCPFCSNDDRALVTSFATRDGRYRVYACDVCHRYLKAYDARNASRPVMVAVDTIATLPLDAAAMQRGYVS
jgi:transcriptional regulator NrdR family protein